MHTYDGSVYSPYSASDIQLEGATLDLKISTAATVQKTVYIKAETQNSPSVQYFQTDVLVCDNLLSPSFSLATTLYTFVGATAAQASYTLPEYSSNPTACNTVTQYDTRLVSPAGNATISSTGCTGSGCRTVEFYTVQDATITFQIRVSFTSTVDSASLTYDTSTITVNVLLGNFETLVLPTAPPQLLGVTSNFQIFFGSSPSTSPTNIFELPIF